MPVLLAVLLTLLLAPSAHAAWFPMEPLDGPGEIERLGTVDLARDGAGGLVYVKRELGVPHVYLSRFTGGAFRAPERLDAGIDLGVSEAAVAASDGYKLGAAWIAGGRVYGAVAPEGAAPGAIQGPSLLFEDPQGRAPSGLAIDLGINGTGWVTFTAPGGGGGDVRAVRLFGNTWEGVPAPLDVDPPQNAGMEGSRPRVAVAADGNPVVVWGEDHADGRRRAYGRRIYGVTPSSTPQELSLTEFEGRPGGPADSPDIDIEWDGSFAWAAFRQELGGISRTIGRRLLGTPFETPFALDGGNPSSAPHIAINGRGEGQFVVRIGDRVAGPYLRYDKLAENVRIDSVGGVTGDPQVAVSDNDNTDVAVVWRRVDGDLRARTKQFGESYAAEAVISRADMGPVTEDGFGVSADRTGNFVVAALTGNTGSRRVAVAFFDRPPGTPVTPASSRYQRKSRPLLRWRRGLDLWGDQTFKVFIDRVQVGTAIGDSFTPATPLPDGPHLWRVVAVDRRGQETPSRERYVRVDVNPPRIVVRVKGKKKAGKPLTIQALAYDGRGSGVASTRIEFGDKTGAVLARRAKHRYRRGKFTLRVSARDRIGNVGVKKIRLTIKK